MSKSVRDIVRSEGFSLRKIMQLGEPFIWLAGAATTITLFMITMMLCIILFEGATFFWPSDIQKITLKSGEIKAGVLRGREIYEPKDDDGKPLQAIKRIQLMLGNRDFSGTDFLWVDAPEISATEYPKDLMYVERQEWGPMIAWPVSLNAAGKELKAQDPAFVKTLATEVSRGRDRFDEIRHLERDVIGHINHQIEGLRRKERGAELKAQGKGRALSQSERDEFAGKLKALQSEFEGVEKKIHELQAENEAYTAAFKSAEGDEKSFPISSLVRVIAPNDMGLFSKSLTYAARLWEFIFDEPRESNTEGGVFPAIFGTVLMSLLMTVIVVPFGVLAALYLREYAKQGLLVSIVRIAVNNLAGVPSIVFGVFGLGFFVYFVGGGIDQLFFPEALPTPTFGTGGILWASLTLALLTVPVVVVATEESLAFVPRGIRDGALACGATKWQMIRTVVLPAAAPGILTGVILSMARGIGEVAPLMITGVVKLAPNLPFDGYLPFMHFDRKFMHLGFHIYDVGFQSPNVEAAMPMVYTTTLLLIMVVVGLNLFAMWIRNYLRNKYRTSGF